MSPSSDPSGRWRQQWKIFHEVVELPSEKRAAYLDDACAGDDGLRDEVAALIASHEQGSPVLDEPPPLVGAANEQVTIALPKVPLESLSPGRVLVGRFEVIRPLGEGGMGAVFEARDRELETSVALKVLRPEIAGNIKVQARFRREIGLARKVTHPNVCRLFDLFVEGEMAFLTMEMLEGETLSDHLQREGRLSAAEARPIVRGIGSALEAAHSVGVIHRDLKTSNVMLVPEPGGLRVVVTDFGLAMSFGPESEDSSRLTRSGETLGTPAYMAPEQLEGGEITPATDIYALGIIIYEMVTGSSPFRGETPFSVAFQRLQAEAPSPRLRAPDLERGWERAILCCLERAPADRFQSPREVVEALDPGAPTRLPPSRRRLLRNRALAVGVILAVVAVGLLVGRGILRTSWSRIATESPAGSAVPISPVIVSQSVLITAFDNRTGEAEYDGIVEAVLARELSNSPSVVVVPRPRVSDVLRLMERPLDTRVDAELGYEIAARDGGIRAVVAGTVEKLGSTYLVSAVVLDGDSGVAVGSLSEEAEGVDQMLLAVRRLSTGMRELLGEQLASIRQTEERLVQVTTPSLRALRLYTEADAVLNEHTDRVGAAVELLEQALADDPDFASAHLLLAIALRRMNRPEVEFLTHIDRAMALADTVPDRERYFIRGLYFLFHGNTEEEEANWQALLRLDPEHFWANQVLALNRARGGDVAGAIPYQVNKARARPLSLDANSDASQILAMLTDRIEEARGFRDRVLEIAETAGAYRNEYELTWARLFEAHERWLAGDIQGHKEELDRWLEALPGLTGMEARWMRSALRHGHRGIGMAKRSLQRDLTDPETTFSLGMDGWMRSDFMAVESQLEGEWADRWWGTAAVQDPLRVAFLARGGFVDEAREVLGAFEKLDPSPVPALVPESTSLLIELMRGEILLAEAQYAQGVEMLETVLRQNWSRSATPVRNSIYFISSLGLASGWMKLGDPERAEAALLRASEQRHRTHPFARESWLKVQAELARLYRDQGRDGEAREIEAELWNLLEMADRDFWLVQELVDRRDGH